MANPHRQLRLIFAYAGGVLRLVGQFPVTIAVARGDLDAPLAAGTYVEARTATGQPLARVLSGWEPTRQIEVPPETPGGEMTRVDLGEADSVFEVIIEAPEEATQVAVRQVAPGVLRPEGRPTGPLSTDLAVFPLAHEEENEPCSRRP